MASITPPVITSVRANAPQKLTSRLLTRGLYSTSSSAGVAFVYASPPISRKFAGRPPKWFTASSVVIVSPAPLASTPTSPSSSMYVQAELAPAPFELGAGSRPASARAARRAALAGGRREPASMVILASRATTSSPAVTTSGLISTRLGVDLAVDAVHRDQRAATGVLDVGAGRSGRRAARRRRLGQPGAYVDGERVHLLGVARATSSMSMPPRAENSTSGPLPPGRRAPRRTARADVGASSTSSSSTAVPPTWCPAARRRPLRPRRRVGEADPPGLAALAGRHLAFTPTGRRAGGGDRRASSACGRPSRRAVRAARPREQLLALVLQQVHGHRP